MVDILSYVVNLSCDLLYVDELKVIYSIVLLLKTIVILLSRFSRDSLRMHMNDLIQTYVCVMNGAISCLWLAIHDLW